MQPKPNIVHLPVYQPGKSIEAVKKELGLSEIIKMASNENPYGCSPKAKEAIIAEMVHTNLYPDGASLQLADAISKHLGVGTDQLIFGAGSDEVILMIARAFFVKGDETIMADRTFPQYKHNAEIEGAISIEVPLRNGQHDLQAMLEKVTDRTKIIWICNPNNPTGTIVSHSELAAFISKVPKHVLVVLDEAYVEYTISSEFPDSLALLKSYKNIIILRTFSKIYGLASLRIGYGVGHPSVIHNINQVREPFNTTRFAQAAAIAALEDQIFIAYCRNENANGIVFLTEHFKRLNLEYFPAHGNFIMVHLGRASSPVFEALQRKGIIIRSGSASGIGFPHAIRVTVGNRQQNEKFISALEEVLNETEKGLPLTFSKTEK